MNATRRLRTGMAQMVPTTAIRALPFAILIIAAYTLFSFHGRLTPSSDRLSGIGNNEGARLRILPLGDSITEGYASTDRNGYRKSLGELLRAANHPIEFIGSLQDGVDNPDNKHEGWGAHSIDQIYKRVTDDNILKEQPNLVLLHAGTNDIDRSPASPEEPYDGAPDRLGKLIDLVLTECPETVLLVATIIRDDHVGAQARANAFNRAVPKLVKTRAAQGRKIALVDQKSIGGHQLIDQIHPTDEGYRAMALNWYHGIRRIPEGWISSV